MAEYNNLKIIKESLAKMSSEATPSVIQKSINKVIKELDSYLNRLELFYNTLTTSAQEKYAIYQDAEASDITTSYGLYKSLKNFDEEATEILKEGYILIDEIRTFFTGEKIIYDIGFTYRGNENLYEIQMSLEDILKNTKAVYNTRSKLNNLYKLRMNVRKGDLVQKYNEAHAYIETVDDGSSTVWSSIIRYLTQRVPGENKGNVYEAYKVYVSQFSSNRIPPASFSGEDFDTVLTQVKSNIAASTKGGDFLNYQIKFISSAPSLMTTSTVRKTLQEVLLVFKNLAQGGANQEIVQQVNNLFVKNPDLNSVAGKMEEGMRQEAEKQVQERIMSLNKS